jgi:predicted Zn-dependent protease
VTLAHEFGHALGLDHHNDPYALMYPQLSKQNLKEFRLGAADLVLLNKR